MTYLVEHLSADPFFKKFHRLNVKLAEVIQDYSLVSFVPLNVQVRAHFCTCNELYADLWHDFLTVVIPLKDKESMTQVLRTVDKANGYCFGDLEERNLQAMMSAAVGADFQFNAYPLSYCLVLCFCSCYVNTLLFISAITLLNFDDP